MSAPVETPAMRSSQKLYERLLALYPKAHRDEYGQPMAQLFRDQSRDAWRTSRRWGLVALWLRVLPDLLKTSMLERLSELKGKKSMADKISDVARPSSAPLKAFFGVAVLVFLVVFMLSTIITFLLPETFASSARIKVGPDRSDSATQNSSSGATGTSYDPYFIQTEFEVIQSEVVLGKVIELLDLNSVWGKKYGGTKLKTWDSLAILKGRLDLRPVRNTSFIEVRVYSEDRDEAARVANAIVETYRDYRQRELVELIRGGIKALEARYQEQEEKVRRTQNELEHLRNELGISAQDAQAAGPSPAADAETMRRLQAQMVEASSRANESRLTLSRLKALSNDELRQVLPRTRPDTLLTELLSQLNLAEQNLARLKKDFSPTHPESVRAQAAVDDLNKKVDQSVSGVMTAMAHQMDIAETSVTMMKEQIEDAKKRDVEIVGKTQPYFDKKRELDGLIGFSRVLQMKLASEQIDVSLPKTTLVQVMDRAVPGARPVRPNKELNLFLGGCAGVVLGSGAAGLTAWWIHRHRRKTAAIPAAA